MRHRQRRRREAVTGVHVRRRRGRGCGRDRLETQGRHGGCASRGCERRRLLLRDAMEVAAAQEHSPRGDQDDRTGGEQRLELCDKGHTQNPHNTAEIKAPLH